MLQGWVDTHRERLQQGALSSGEMGQIARFTALPILTDKLTNRVSIHCRRSRRFLTYNSNKVCAEQLHWAVVAPSAPMS